MNRSSLLTLLVTLVAILTATPDAAAYLHPGLGRFVQRDPAGHVDGANLYQYVRSNPARYPDPSGLLLIAVDGTSSRPYLGGSGGGPGAPPTSTGFFRSHVRNFFSDYSNMPKMYFHGPDNYRTGSDAPGIHRDIIRALKTVWCRDTSQPIDMVGHSRGGYIVMEVARELKDKGICCNGHVIKPVPVRFLGLYDPVDMVPGYGGAETIPENVSTAISIFAAGAPGARSEGDGHYEIVGDQWVYVPDHERSRSVFNRADGGAENSRSTRYSENWIFATHAAIGGAPWDGDHPVGHSQANDIQGAIEADQIVRRGAIGAGVPVRSKGIDEYGY